MKNPILSIIIPHFENADGLEILLNSIFTDSIKYPEITFEVLVIDDYSCEHTQKDLIKLQSKYDFKLYHNNSIKSAGTCRNIGIDNSSGKWLLFADSDDYYLPDFLKRVSKYFVSDYDIIYFSPISRIYGTNIEANRNSYYAGYIEEYFRNNNETQLRTRWSPPWSKLIRLEFIIRNNIKFDSVIASNDKYFSINAGLKAKAIYADKTVIYCVTSRKNSLVSKNSLEYIISRIKVNIKVNKLLSNYNIKQYRFEHIKFLIEIAHFGFLPLLEIFLFIIKNGDNPFVNFSKKLHEYLMSKKYKKGKKTFKEMLISAFKLPNFIFKLWK